MANFCSNCGAQLKPGSRFCPSCGAGLETGDKIISQWEAEERDTEGYTRRRGFLILTRNELIYLSKPGLFSKKQKEYFRINLSQIKKAYKTPLINAVYLSYNKAPAGSGVFKKMISARRHSFKMGNAKLFIEKLKELNPSIK